MGPSPIAQILAARKQGDWDRVIALEKQSVRDGCAIEYRWRELANTLVVASRPKEALAVLQEMDTRGFEVNPSLIGTEHQALRSFLKTALFRSSALGRRIASLERISDQRRARYRRLVDALPPDRRPPENYVAKKACPFECCRFGNWSVRQDTELVDAPGGSRVVGRARKGTRIVGITGEVHLKPRPVVVLGAGDLPKDSIAFVLDYQGEGYAHVYTRGKVISTFVGVADYCFRVSESCWGEELSLPAERTRPVWWVKVRL